MMNDGKSQDFPGHAGQRRQLAKVQYSLSPNVIELCRSGYDGKDLVDPLTVRAVACASEPTAASFKLAFAVAAGDLLVEVRDVDSPCVALQIDATVEWYKKPWSPLLSFIRRFVGSDTDEDDKSAPEPPVKVTLDGEGRIGSFYRYTLRALTVHLEAYALDGPGCPFSAVLGGLDALRLEKTLSDVELRVGGEVFRAHRAVLAANSPVFRAMFSHGLARTGNPGYLGFPPPEAMFISDLEKAQDGVVVIEGASPTAFGLLLKFLYTASVDGWNWKGCELELLELADRYRVFQLKAVCERRLLRMDWSTALGILENADKLAVSSDVCMRAVRVVLDSWEAVRVTSQWRDFRAARPALADGVLVAQQVDAERIRSECERQGKEAELKAKEKEWEAKERLWKSRKRAWERKEAEWEDREMQYRLEEKNQGGSKKCKSCEQELKQC